LGNEVINATWDWIFGGAPGISRIDDSGDKDADEGEIDDNEDADDDVCAFGLGDDRRFGDEGILREDIGGHGRIVSASSKGDRWGFFVSVIR
jgi:hypothetical protein